MRTQGHAKMMYRKRVQSKDVLNASTWSLLSGIFRRGLVFMQVVKSNVDMHRKGQHRIYVVPTAEAGQSHCSPCNKEHQFPLQVQHLSCIRQCICTRKRTPVAFMTPIHPTKFGKANPSSGLTMSRVHSSCHRVCCRGRKVLVAYSVAYSSA